jgi:hypothetical protein
VGDESAWRDTSGSSQPNDGETVSARQQYDAEPTLVIFRARPVPRWESPDGVHVYQFRFFMQWRRFG